MSYSDFDRQTNDRREILVKIGGFSLVIQPYCTAEFASLSDVEGTVLSQDCACGEEAVGKKEA